MLFINRCIYYLIRSSTCVRHGSVLIIGSFTLANYVSRASACSTIVNSRDLVFVCVTCRDCRQFNGGCDAFLVIICPIAIG